MQARPGLAPAALEAPAPGAAGRGGNGEAPPFAQACGPLRAGPGRGRLAARGTALRAQGTPWGRISGGAGGPARPPPRFAGIRFVPPPAPRTGSGAQAQWLLGVRTGAKRVVSAESRPGASDPSLSAGPAPQRGPAFGAAGREPACPPRRARLEPVRLRAGPQGALHGGPAGGGGRRAPGRGECEPEAAAWGVGCGGELGGLTISFVSAPHPEQGGQILRVSTALSCLLGLPLRVQKIRAGRSTPGLR